MCRSRKHRRIKSKKISNITQSLNIARERGDHSRTWKKLHVRSRWTVLQGLDNFKNNDVDSRKIALPNKTIQKVSKEQPAAKKMKSFFVYCYFRIIYFMGKYVKRKIPRRHGSKSILLRSRCPFLALVVTVVNKTLDFNSSTFTLKQLSDKWWKVRK